MGTIKSEIEQIVSSDISTAVAQIDSRLENMENAVKFFQRSKGYQGYLTRSFSSDVNGESSLDSIKSDVNLIYFLSDIADDFFIAIPEYDTIFSTNGMQRSSVYLKRSYLSSEYSVDRLQNEFMHATQHKILHNENLTTRKGTGEYLTFIYPLSKTIQGKGGTAAFCVPVFRLSSLLKPRTEDLNVQTIVFDNQGNLLFSYNMESIVEESITEKELEQSSLSTSIGDFHIVTHISPYNGWKYRTLIPKDNSLVDSTFKINRFFLIYLIIVVVFGTVMIFSFLHLNYQPIKRLREQTKDIITLGESSNDDLVNIGTAIIHLKDENNTNLNEIRATRIHRLLNGYYASVDEFNADCEQISLSFSRNYFFVSIFLFTTFPVSGASVSDALLHLFRKDGRECEAISNRKSKTLIFVHATDQRIKPDNELFYSALGLLHDQFGLNATVGIGRILQGTSNLEYSTIQANVALDFRFNAGSSKVIFYDSCLSYFAQNKSYPHKEINKLQNAVKAINTTEISSIIDEIITFIRNPTTSILGARCICWDLIKTLMTSPYLTHNGSYRLSDAMIQLNDKITRNSILNISLDIQKDIPTYFNPETIDDEHEQKLLLDMINFIDKNYCRADFSIQELSDKFKIGHSNLSQFFKNNTNQGLLEYLINKRIEKAKELLHSSTLSVKEISYSIGYYNVTSFIRRFKNHEGVTPNEYRFTH